MIRKASQSRVNFAIAAFLFSCTFSSAAAHAVPILTEFQVQITDVLTQGQAPPGVNVGTRLPFLPNVNDTFNGQFIVDDDLLLGVGTELISPESFMFPIFSFVTGTPVVVDLQTPGLLTAIMVQFTNGILDGLNPVDIINPDIDMFLFLNGVEFFTPGLVDSQDPLYGIPVARGAVSYSPPIQVSGPTTFALVAIGLLCLCVFSAPVRRIRIRNDRS